MISRFVETEATLKSLQSPQPLKYRHLLPQVVYKQPSTSVHAIPKKNVNKSPIGIPVVLHSAGELAPASSSFTDTISTTEPRRTSSIHTLQPPVRSESAYISVIRKTGNPPPRQQETLLPSPCHDLGNGHQGHHRHVASSTPPLTQTKNDSGFNDFIQQIPYQQTPLWNTARTTTTEDPERWDQQRLLFDSEVAETDDYRIDPFAEALMRQASLSGCSREEVAPPAYGDEDSTHRYYGEYDGEEDCIDDDLTEPSPPRFTPSSCPVDGRLIHRGTSPIANLIVESDRGSPAKKLKSDNLSTPLQVTRESLRVDRIAQCEMWVINNLEYIPSAGKPQNIRLRDIYSAYLEDVKRSDNDDVIKINILSKIITKVFPASKKRKLGERRNQSIHFENIFVRPNRRQDVLPTPSDTVGQSKTGGPNPLSLSVGESTPLLGEASSVPRQIHDRLIAYLASPSLNPFEDLSLDSLSVSDKQPLSSANLHYLSLFQDVKYGNPVGEKGKLNHYSTVQ